MRKKEQYGVDNENDPEIIHENNEEVKMERSKRAATIECCENSIMLGITRDDFNNIIMSLMQENLDFKIKLIVNIHIFDVFILVLKVSNFNLLH